MHQETLTYRLNNLDYKKPYKITCPEHGVMPLRFDSLSQADKVFESLKFLGMQAIYTHTDVNSGVTKILSYSSPKHLTRRRRQ